MSKFEEFEKLIEAGIEYADTIRDESLESFQNKMFKYVEENKIADAVKPAIEETGERTKCLKMFMALCGEGKKLEDSLLR
jgi:hypothetical protein